MEPALNGIPVLKKIRDLPVFLVSRNPYGTVFIITITLLLMVSSCLRLGVGRFVLVKYPKLAPRHQGNVIGNVIGTSRV
jgi:hypothetical protein